MGSFWEIIVSNTVVAAALALGAIALGRLWKNAAASHLLWIAVLLKLFTPPIVTAEAPFAWSALSLGGPFRFSRSKAVPRLPKGGPRKQRRFPARI